MTEKLDGRLDAAMHMLQASLLADGGTAGAPEPALRIAERDAGRHDSIDLSAEPDRSPEDGDGEADQAAQNEAGVLAPGEPVALQDQSLDLAELASLSDVSIAPEDMPLVIGAGAAGVLAIALIADSGGGGGGGEVPTDPTSPTDPTDPTDPSPPVDNSFDLLGDNPEAGAFTISGTTGEVDVARFAFDTDMEQALSDGVGQVFTILNFDAAEGDRIQFVQAEGSTLSLEQFIEIVDPIANGFADTTTFNFLTAADELSAQIVAPGSFDPPADASAPFFDLIEVV